MSERMSPDGFVPSSSPESVADAEISRFPDLSFIKLEPPSPCPSPPIPIMPCAWGKGQPRSPLASLSKFSLQTVSREVGVVQ